MAEAEGAIVNPLSGERIVITRSAAGTAGAVLAWDLFLAPDGAVPSRHVHPEQEEHFTVLGGRVRFRVGRRMVTAAAGETVRVPRGVVHHFANAGPDQAHLAVLTVPAFGMEAMLTTAAALARDQHAAGRRRPRALDLILFLREFRREVEAPYLPARLVQLAVGPLAWVAAGLSLDTSYRRLRRPDGITASA